MSTSKFKNTAKELSKEWVIGSRSNLLQRQSEHRRALELKREEKLQQNSMAKRPLLIITSKAKQKASAFKSAYSLKKQLQATVEIASKQISEKNQAKKDFKRFMAGTEVELDALRSLIDTIVHEKVTSIVAIELAKATELESINPTTGIAGAYARGTAFKLAELNKPENMTLANAAIFSGRSDRMINVARSNGELYALISEGKTRGFRYPSWQFDAAPSRLKLVLAAFNEAQASCWVIHNFLTRPNHQLDDIAPRNVILDPEGNIDQVIRAIHSRFVSDQGVL